MLAGELQQLVGVAGLGDDLYASPFKEAREALAEQDIVVGEHHACRRRCRSRFGARWLGHAYPPTTTA